MKIKKIKQISLSLMLMLLLPLTLMLSSCFSGGPESLSITVKNLEGQNVVWHYNQPNFRFEINQRESEEDSYRTIGWIIGFESVNEFGPGLNQKSGKNEQELSFTICIPYNVDSTNLEVKVNGEVLEAVDVDNDPPALNIPNPNPNSEDPILSITIVKAFKFLKTDLTKDVELTIDGLEFLT